jgi:hypothetical protein
MNVKPPNETKPSMNKVESIFHLMLRFFNMLDFLERKDKRNTVPQAAAFRHRFLWENYASTKSSNNKRHAAPEGVVQHRYRKKFIKNLYNFRLQPVQAF